jgi:hypothetical protein
MAYKDEILPFECPICGRDKYKSLEDLLKHIDLHNSKDPEVDISVVAEREKIIERMF